MPIGGKTKLFGSHQKELLTKEKIVSFYINGKLFKVEAGDVPATLSLARFIRDHAKLTGTKVMCNQAGCGACVVTAEMRDPNGVDGWKTKSVNTCVTPVLVCDGWHITTVEGIGNYKQGLHPIQERLADFHGSQCGYCSPGMVMQMNSYMATNPESVTSQDIEDLFDGNVCRCTGYRPILDAFKSFADDANEEIRNRLSKLPESAQRKCPITQQACVGRGKCGNDQPSNEVGCGVKGMFGSNKNSEIGLQNTTEGKWLFPQSLDELIHIFKTLPDDNNYRLVAGNTGTGIYDHDTIYDTYIDILKIPELVLRKTTPNLELGGGTNLHDLIEIMEGLAESDPLNYNYGKQFGIHLRKVAHTAVRHTGTIAGNLMLKHKHNWFPSDVFCLLEGSGAKLVVKSVPTTLGHNNEHMYSPSEWLKQSMHKKVILKIIFPKLNSQDYTFCSYKITPRRTNAHAYVNSSMKLCTNKEFVVSERPSIVYGGITEEFIHASKTEEFLFGKCIKDQTTLQGAMDMLQDEIVPWDDPSEASIEYRKLLSKSLLYKTILSALGDSVSSSNLKSAANRELLRGCSKGKQSYPNFEEDWPLYQPIPKIESKSQCTGEAEYIGDIPDFNGLVHCALVTADQGVGELDDVDPSEALKMPGVVAYIDHKDIPGKNCCQIFTVMMPLPPREIFSSGKITHIGQTVGAICAETPEQARRAAKAVKITYKNLQKPVTYIRDAMKTAARVVELDAIPGFPPQGDGTGDVKEEENNSFKTFEGEVEIGSQYHYYMETITHVVRPIENGEFEVFPNSQWMHSISVFVAQVLNIASHKIDVKVRRLGGSYGGKGGPALHSCCVVAVCANKLNRPVKLVMDLKSTMETYGKRAPYLLKYKAGVTEEGKLTFVDTKIFADAGCEIFDNDAGEAVHFAQNVYNAKAWKISPYAVVTDVMPNTWCRAPGSTQAHACMETIMERIAFELNLDPVDFRMRNLLKKGDRLIKAYGTLAEENPIPKMVHQLKQTADYLERKKNVDAFNQKNKWIKRGMSLVPCKYYINLNALSLPFPVLISIYENDGSVALTHGGIEMGQGINTKVAQVVASTLGLASANEVSVKPGDAFTSANAMITGGSMASELVCQVALKCARKIRDQLDELEKEQEKACSWRELIKLAYSKGIDLTAHYSSNANIEGIDTYNVWGAIITEVEVDMLTGEKNIIRSDIIEDTGSSLSPEVDIGQIEGSFIYGVGLWTSEVISFHPETGKILQNDTWTYKPPMYQDIPEEMNVTLYEGDRNTNQERGVLGSKATGEPATHMGISVAFAIRNAIDAMKKDIEPEGSKWYPLDAPATLEKIQLTSGVTSKYFIL